MGILDGYDTIPAYITGSYEIVETCDQMIAAVEDIAKETVVGVDIENNNTNSYEGFICLVQISLYPPGKTPKTYIFDVL